MALTQAYIIEKSSYTNWAFEFQEYSPLLGEVVRVSIFSESKDKAEGITDRVVDRINSFFQADPAEIEPIKQVIWAHFEMRIEDAEYGEIPQKFYDKHEGNMAQANREYFGYKNAEDSFAAAEVDCVYFDDYFDEHHRYSSIWFKVPWDDEHGVIVGLKDGKVLR